MYLDQPDGKPIASAFGGTPVQAVGDYVEDHPFCFTADETEPGDYTIRWVAYRGSATASYTFALD